MFNFSSAMTLAFAEKLFLVECDPLNTSQLLQLVLNQENSFSTFLFIFENLIHIYSEVCLYTPHFLPPTLSSTLPPSLILITY